MLLPGVQVEHPTVLRAMKDFRLMQASILSFRCASSLRYPLTMLLSRLGSSISCLRARHRGFLATSVSLTIFSGVFSLRLFVVGPAHHVRIASYSNVVS